MSLHKVRRTVSCEIDSAYFSSTTRSARSRSVRRRFRCGAKSRAARLAAPKLRIRNQHHMMSPWADCEEATAVVSGPVEVFDRLLGMG